jgi:hypothetical protein
MILEAALLAVGCTLFVNMGLSDAIQEFLEIKFKVLSCVKCFTFWTVLVFLTISGAGFYVVVSASFILSYLALWLDLGLSALNKIYNELYEQILSTPDTRSSKKVHKHSKDGKTNSAEVR